MLGSLLTRRNLIVGGSAAGLTVGAAVLTNGFGLIPRELEVTKTFHVDGIAIRGADPVAYFSDKKAVIGQQSIASEWNGATWYFASTDNRVIFEKNPIGFAPAYGGFCAWAVAEKGILYSTQPDNWAIVDGRLFLNYNDHIQGLWDANRSMYIQAADQKWQDILRQALGKTVWFKD